MKYSRKIPEESEVILFDRPKSIGGHDRGGLLRFAELTADADKRLSNDGWAELLTDIKPLFTLYYDNGFWNFRNDETAMKENTTVWASDKPASAGRYTKRSISGREK